jgi:hypothetical protein
MAMQWSVAIRNAGNDAITTAAGTSALIKMYSGTIPTNVGTALGAQVLLATLPCSVTFAPASASGVLTLNAISNDTSADAAGTGSFFQITTSGGTAIGQGTLGTSGADINLATVTFSIGLVVSVTSFTYTQPGA